MKNTGTMSLAEVLRRFEILYIRQALLNNEGNQSQTARDLGINRATLWRKLEADEGRS